MPLYFSDFPGPWLQRCHTSTAGTGLSEWRDPTAGDNRCHGPRIGHPGHLSRALVAQSWGFAGKMLISPGNGGLISWFPIPIYVPNFPNVTCREVGRTRLTSWRKGKGMYEMNHKIARIANIVTILLYVSDSGCNLSRSTGEWPSIYQPWR